MATYTRTCKRCNGTGEYPTPGGRMGECWGCGNSEGPRGHVIVRTGEDKRRMDEAKAFVAAFLPQLRRRAMEIAPNGTAATTYASRAKDGLYALAQREPERLTKLRASVNGGRVDDVIRALVEYPR